VRAPVATTPRHDVPKAPRKPGQSRFDRIVEQAEQRPKAPWHPFPLVELSVLVGIVLIVIGLINHDSHRGRLAIVFGAVLASIGGLETAVRDHFSGFRSHSSLLATMPAIVGVLVLALLRTAPGVLLIAAIVIFAIGFYLLRSSFKRRTGVAFKV
jgi:hypothetical protein